MNKKVKVKGNGKSARPRSILAASQGGKGKWGEQERQFQEKYNMLKFRQYRNWLMTWCELTYAVTEKKAVMIQHINAFPRKDFEFSTYLPR